MKRFIAVAVVVAALTACGGGNEAAVDSSETLAPATAAPQTPATSETSETLAPATAAPQTPTTVVEAEPVAATRDVAYRQLGEQEEANDLRAGRVKTGFLDVWAPTSAGPWPVLVLLHGLVPNSRTGYEVLAERIAAGGAVVYNVDWPVGLFLEDAKIIACAVGFARSTAADYGGSPDRVTLLGHSAGGSMGATVALAAELLEPIEDCAVASASGIPDAFVGVAGRYDYAISGVASSLKETDPAAWEIVDPYTNIGRNPGLEVYLLHGEDDLVNSAQSAVDFDQALRDAGYEVHLTVLEGVGHDSPVAPSFDAFQETVAMALEALHG